MGNSTNAIICFRNISSQRHTESSRTEPDTELANISTSNPNPSAESDYLEPTELTVENHPGPGPGPGPRSGPASPPSEPSFASSQSYFLSFCIYFQCFYGLSNQGLYFTNISNVHKLRDSGYLRDSRKQFED